MRALRTFAVALSLPALLAVIALLSPSGQSHAEPAQGPAATVSVVTKTLTLNPIGDTYVSSFQPGTNFGGNPTLNVSKNNITAVVDATSLLQFDLTGIPAGAVITRAELRMFQSDACITCSPSPWSIIIGRALQSWNEFKVTWSTKPNSVPYSSESSPPDVGQTMVWDVTQLVADWVYHPQAIPNFGLELSGGSTSLNSRVYDSREGQVPPELVVEYTEPVASAVIPRDEAPVRVDGICDTQTEYAGADVYPFISSDGLATVYLKHDGGSLYVCIQDALGDNPNRFFSVYLDTDNQKEKLAEPDDYSLRVQFDPQTEKPFTSSLAGTGQGGYSPARLTGWDAWAVIDRKTSTDSAEYQIPLSLATQYCGAPFGLAVYRHDVHFTGDDHGWPSNQFYDQPFTWVNATLASPNCIRVCTDSPTTCTPAAGATVYRFPPGSTSPDAFSVDSMGYVQNQHLIQFGDSLWARDVVSETESYTLFNTSGPPEKVTEASFNGTPPGTMTLVVDGQNPLMVHDLTISAQWNLEGNPAYKTKLAADLVSAADFLYDFTNGQMTLGNITVYQDSENWDMADVWLYANNNFRPWADAGGVVTSITPDPEHGSEGLSYLPGHVYMGATWNRFHLPGVVSIPGVDVSEDWSLAFAHEMGHYLLYLFDTYLNVVGGTTLVETDTCTGSAMGWVYEPGNTEFVYDPTHWSANCGGTLANYLTSRTEWQTINLWHPWTVVPTVVDTGPSAPPMNLTSVTFVPPPPTSTLPLSNQTFNLNYQDGETNSAEARAFLIRNDRVIDQGKPAVSTNQITLYGAQSSDRFCVFDINDHAEGGATPRHQFGCEILAAGDNQLDMKKDTSWSPVVLASPVTSTTMQIAVTVPISVTTLKARLFPENKVGSPDINLTGSGGLYSGQVVLSVPAPAAYVQVWVDESFTETNPRREIMVDYGIGGGGQHGPASRLGGAPVVSSDGKAKFISSANRILGDGEFIALQSMAGTPQLPTDLDIVGQSYHLIAIPTSLATPGFVSILYDPSVLPAAAAPASIQATTQIQPIIHFWDGTNWRPLVTEISETPGGDNQATAPSEGVGVYGLLISHLNQQVYLPMIQR